MKNLRIISATFWVRCRRGTAFDNEDNLAKQAWRRFQATYPDCIDDVQSWQPTIWLDANEPGGAYVKIEVDYERKERIQEADQRTDPSSGSAA